MDIKNLNICFVGLTVTSSWGNGHATTFRSLIKELHKMGHNVTFLERDVPWYADNRDMSHSACCDICLYHDLEELREKYTTVVGESDFVIMGSYVPEGIAVADWLTGIAGGVTAFYDIDTPVTLQLLQSGKCEYLAAEQISDFDLYLSFTGGPILKHLENQYHSPQAKPLYCSVDPDLYYPVETEKNIDLGYLGTYSADRQPALEELLIRPAFCLPQQLFYVAGPQYPSTIKWPANIGRTNHLPPEEHRFFYNLQRFTLNITRKEMIKWGYAPSVRLFEAMACGTPVISDYWEGLNSFFTFDQEILVAKDTQEVINYLNETSGEERVKIGQQGRTKILQQHTSAIRALELTGYYHEIKSRQESTTYVK